VGRTGLRAGWSIVMFALLVAGMVLARHVVLDALGPALSVGPQDLQNTPSLFLIVQEGSLAILILAATFAMAKVEGRWIWNYGLASPHLVRNFATGAVGGMAIFSALIGVMTVGHYLEFDGNALVGVNAIGYGLFWAAYFFLVGFFEETFFRGYLLTTLARGIGFWPAAIGSSILFGIAHLPNSGEDLAGIAVVILGGIFLSLCLRLTGSLWLGIGIHTAFGWAESYVYGTANSGNALVQGHLLSAHPLGDPRFSGGAVGPEGSYICAAMFLLLIGLVWAALILKRPPPPSCPA
jgi:membrane protease YdiL (CAAX protease family)